MDSVRRAWRPPPGRGKCEIQTLLHVPSPKSAVKFDFGAPALPRPLGDVASFGDDTPMGIRIAVRPKGSSASSAYRSRIFSPKQSPSKEDLWSPMDRGPYSLDAISVASCSVEG